MAIECIKKSQLSVINVHRLIKSLPHTERDPYGKHAVLAQEIKGLVGSLTSDKQKECIALFVENSNYCLIRFSMILRDLI